MSPQKFWYCRHPHKLWFILNNYGHILFFEDYILKLCFAGRREGVVRADMLDVDELEGKVAEKMECPELRGTLWT